MSASLPPNSHHIDPTHHDQASQQDPWLERNWMVLVILFGLIAVISFDTWFPTM